jgi:hypothetical protein
MPTTEGGTAGDTIYLKFTSRDANVPATLSGSPVISIYKDASTTQSTTGVTLTVDFDSVTGLNHISVDTSQDGTFYANDHTFYAVITTGTVGGTSVVGEVVGKFVLATPIVTAGSTLAVDGSGRVDVGKILGTASQGAAGYVGVDWSKLTNKTSTNALTGTTIASTQQVDVNTIKTQTVTASGGVTFPAATLASTTNITAGTITTTTNLTNLPDMPNNWVTAAGIQAAALNGKGDWLTSGSFPSNFSSLVIDGSGHVTLSTASLATFFTTDTTKTFSDAVSGSVVKEIADNASGSGSSDVNVISWAGHTVAATNTNGVPVVDVGYIGGAAVASYTGTAQAGAASTITLQSDEPTTADLYKGRAIEIVDGTGAGQGRFITGYSTGRVATVNTPWVINPDNTSKYSIFDVQDVNVTTWLGEILTEPVLTADDIPTPAQNADGLLGRNVEGGSDGGRTVAEAFYTLRNKVVIAGGTLTVYKANDSTVAWTASVATSASNPITGIDPA